MRSHDSDTRSSRRMRHSTRSPSSDSIAHSRSVSASRRETRILPTRRVVDDRHRFHDPLEARAAAAPQHPGRIAGLADRHAESVQHGEEHLRVGTAADAGGVEVLEHDAGIGRETPQRGRENEGLSPRVSVRPGDEAGDVRIGERRMAGQHAGDEDRIDTGLVREPARQ